MSDPKFTSIIKSVNEKRDVNGIVLDGKKYLQVRDRVEVFRAEFGDQYGIDTVVMYSTLQNGDCVVASAKITDKLTGNVLSSGHAMEIVGATNFNNVSAVESAETSAVGRALAFFGLAGGEFPSVDEMQGVGRKEEAKRMHEPNERQMVNPPSLYSSDRVLFKPRFGPDVDTWEEATKVIDEVSGIRDEQTLMRYWTELKEFRDYISDPGEDPHIIAELKAVFSMVKGQIKGKR